MNGRTDIVYLLSHGFAARMVLQTDLMDRLVQKGLSVTIVVPPDAHAETEQMARRYGVPVVAAPDFGKRFSDEYVLLRRYLFEQVEQNPALFANHNRWRESSFLRRLRLDLYLLINKLSVTSGGFRRLLTRFERRMLKRDRATQLLAELDPELVVSTYPVNSLESVFLVSAHELGFTTVGHLLSWDNITSKGRFAAPPDYYVTWGPIMSDEVTEYYGIDNENIFECGVAHFDRHLQPLDTAHLRSLLERLELNPELPYLFFGMSGPSTAPGERSVVSWLAEKVELDVFGEDVQLIIRPHPQNVAPGSPNDLTEELASLVSSRVAVNFPAVRLSGLKWNMEDHDLDDLVTLVGGAAVTLNSGSTLSIDAIMRDKPVVMTAFDGDLEFPWYASARRMTEIIHIRKLVELGGVELVQSFEELRAAVHAYLEDPTRHAQGRRRTRMEECGPCDGMTVDRIAAAFMDILGRENRETAAGPTAHPHHV